MTYDNWKSTEPEFWFEPLNEIEPEPSEEQMLLNRAWDEINALGGSNAARTANRYRAGWITGNNAGIESALEILEKLGAQRPQERPGRAER